MRALIVVTAAIIWSTYAYAQDAEHAAWWADADLWKIIAPFFGAFLGFLGGTFVNDWLQTRREIRNRRQMIIGVALALKGETLAAADSLERKRFVLNQIATKYKKSDLDEDSHYNEMKIEFYPRFSTSIFEACLSRIHLIDDPDLLADLTQFYSTARTVEESLYYVNIEGVAKGWIEANELTRDRARSVAAKLQEFVDRIE